MLRIELKPPFTLVREDAVIALGKLDAESMDLVVTDPAYQSLEEHRKRGTTTRLKHSKASSNDWFDIFPDERFPDFFRAVYRVLKRNTHFYLHVDAKTMFVVKPMAEAAGFRFWKPLVWDKCMHPDTPVATPKGIRKIGELAPGDRVVTPRGTSPVLASRRTQHKTTLNIQLSDGTSFVVSHDHRFLTSSNGLMRASALKVGDKLRVESIDGALDEDCTTISTEKLIPRARAVYEITNDRSCLWCGRKFASRRAAAAHQARFCEKARSKKAMARTLGVSAKRLQWWFAQGALPAEWVKKLKLIHIVTGRSRGFMQNDSRKFFPPDIELNYDLGRFIGLYAAQGSKGAGIAFALNLHKADSRAFVGRFARSLGLRAHWTQTSRNGCVVNVPFDFARWLIEAFVLGRTASSKCLRPLVYQGPQAFRRGVFDGLNEGDGHFEFESGRDTFVSTSLDLAMFVLRFARDQGWGSRLSRHENDHQGSWRVKFDRTRRQEGLTVKAITSGPPATLVDIALPAPHLFVLGNGVVTHNCRIGMGYHYRSRYEFILFFEKGKRKLKNLAIPDILEVARIANGYPAEKPPELEAILIDQSSDPENWVCDPFMGSASVGAAAISLNRRFFGNDISKTALSIAERRLGGSEWKSSRKQKSSEASAEPRTGES